jgi:hypothetical protein
MLFYRDIIKINENVTGRKLTDDAISYILNGCTKYSIEAKDHGYIPSRESATSFVEEVFSKLKRGEGEITLQELKSKCDECPYPLNLWFC